MSNNLKNKRSAAILSKWSNRLATISLNATIIVAFMIPLVPQLAIVSLLVGVVSLCIRLRIDRSFEFRKLPFDVPVVLFILISMVSILVSPDIAFSFYNFYNLVIVYGLTYFITGQVIRSTKEIKTILIAMAAAAIIVICYGFFQYVFGVSIEGMRWVDNDAFPELQTRVFSTWKNPNILAGYLSIVVCLSVGIMGEIVSNKGKLLISILIIIAILCLGMTYSRGAYLFLSVILLLYGVIKDRRLLLLYITIMIITLLNDSLLVDRVISIFSNLDTSAEMRLAFWDSTILMIQDRPFLGVGWGAFFMVYPQYDYYLQGMPIQIVHPHNLYLNYIAEVGLLGAIPFFWFLFGGIRQAFNLPDNNNDVDDTNIQMTNLYQKRELAYNLHDRKIMNGASIGIGLAFISVALNGITDHLLFNTPSSMLFWQLLALGSSIHLSLKNSICNT